MKRYGLTLRALFLALLFHCSASYGEEARTEFKSPEPEEETTRSDRDIFSADFAKTDLELLLLGTVTKRDSAKAIIKNTVTGARGTFFEGEVIDLIHSEEIMLVRVSRCMAMIERKGRFERLECDSAPLAEIASYRLPTPLSRYKIVDSTSKYKSKIDKFKSKYEEEIVTVSERHKVDPYLVKAVIKAESNFNPDAVSPKNAMGMMQLMPGTASDYGVDDPFDPKKNIEGGVRFLRDLMKYFKGDVELTLAAYNAGRGAVVKHGFKIPPYTETVDYVDKVLRYYKLLRLDGRNH